MHPDVALEFHEYGARWPRGERLRVALEESEGLALPACTRAFLATVGLPMSAEPAFFADRHFDYEPLVGSLLEVNAARGLPTPPASVATWVRLGYDRPNLCRSARDICVDRHGWVWAVSFTGALDHMHLNTSVEAFATMLLGWNEEVVPVLDTLPEARQARPLAVLRAAFEATDPIAFADPRNLWVLSFDVLLHR